MLLGTDARKVVNCGNFGFKFHDKVLQLFDFGGVEVECLQVLTILLANANLSINGAFERLHTNVNRSISSTHLEIAYTTTIIHVRTYQI
jgi:hypothetical protein